MVDLVRSNNNYMHYQSKLLFYYNSFAKKIYPFIPFTYYWYLGRAAGIEGTSILDLGCGWGEPMEVLQSLHRRRATGVDIHAKYLKECRGKNLYETLFKADITLFKPKEKFDLVICSHVLEHMSKTRGNTMLGKFSKWATNRVIVTVPVGDLPQDEYDGNPYQKHESSWFPKDFVKHGFTVTGITPRFLYGEHDRFKEYKLLAFVLFFVAFLLQPFYANHPDKCVYMLCVKKL